MTDTELEAVIARVVGCNPGVRRSVVVDGMASMTGLSEYRIMRVIAGSYAVCESRTGGCVTLGLAASYAGKSYLSIA